MHYLLALILPPVAILFAGKPFQAIFNLAFFVLGLIFFILGGAFLSLLCIAHAMFVVHGRKQDINTQKIIDSLKDR